MGKFEKKPQQTQKEKSGSKKTVLLVSVIAAVVLVVGVFAAFLLLRDDGKIVGNLYVAGVDVGGMTKEQAKQAISERLKLYGENTMEVDLYGRSFPLYTTAYDPEHVQLVDIFGKPMDPSEATEATQEPSESSESSETEPESSETEPETEPTRWTPTASRWSIWAGSRSPRRTQTSRWMWMLRWTPPTSTAANPSCSSRS